MKEISILLASLLSNKDIVERLKKAVDKAAENPEDKQSLGEVCACAQLLMIKQVMGDKNPVEFMKQVENDLRGTELLRTTAN